MEQNAFAQRDMLQAMFLAELYRADDPSVVLKGGGALRFAFGSPRLSEDLDFDVAEHVEPATLRGRIRKTLSRLGWVYTEPKQTPMVLRWKIHHDQYGSFKIEFSKRGTPDAAITTVIDFHRWKIWQVAAVTHLTLGGMFASKMRAILSPTRFVARDVFDLHFILGKAREQGVPLSSLREVSPEQVLGNMMAIDKRQVEEELRPLLPMAYQKMNFDDMVVSVGADLERAGLLKGGSGNVPDRGSPRP